MWSYITCIKQSIENVLRENDIIWPSTIVDSKILKWSLYAVKWLICLDQDYNRIANNISLYPYMQRINIVRPCCTSVLGNCMLT